VNETQPPIQRLTRRPQFLAAAKGVHAARGAVLCQKLARDPDSPHSPEPALIRAGFTATKRLGGAVVRNRAKRRLREAARALLPVHGEAGSDYVFIARQGAAERPWDRLLDDMKRALISLASQERPAPRADQPPTTSPQNSPSAT
jgi:ribonuclease P protein component